MSTPFDASSDLVIVEAEIEGPSRHALLRLALDTGASSTVINRELLVSLGYDLQSAAESTPITTASGVEEVPIITAVQLASLGQARDDLGVVAHFVPSSIGIDGLLGLDFFRDRILTIDFRDGLISLDSGEGED